MPETDTQPGALRELQADAGTRKRFLKMIGGAGAAGALALLAAACGGDDSTGRRAAEGAAKTPMGGVGNDLAILNYALTLEYVEADFYDQAVRSGQITDRAVADLAKRIGEAEHAHVDAITATVKKLGGTPARRPATRFDDVIAGGPARILRTAAIVENVGAAAYLAQAPRITSAEILAAALSIHSVEARHAAALNQLTGRGFSGDGPLDGSVPTGAFASPLPMSRVLDEVKPFLAS
ncbi:MAG TPA: ferritin-like domain-containing protein [Solirubrobacteraceae bacterium]|nr:ferritin-like domain-containing protein [Solirubrobacteraceae bacterium]